ncbi:MAG: Gfo/Idh/MocA family oxidoreductase [Clostridia bacterium]|jgi:predicted dehydrogenase
MYRVGMLGTENSHALAFAKEICLKEEYRDFKITAFYALEKAPSEAIIDKCDLTGAVIVDDPLEMMDMVDCVIVTNRHGKYHESCALPFIEKGKPAFIDKPFTIDPAEARNILRTAKEKNVPITGGSGCKYSPQILELKKLVEENAFGKIYSGVMNFPASTQSEYGGLYFYASHLVEMTLAVYGMDMLAVSAFINNGHITAIAHYNKYDITMQFAASKKYTSVIYGETDVDVRYLDMSSIFTVEFDHFVHMVRTGKSPLSEDELLMPVLVMNAIEKSLELKKTVKIDR